MQTTTRLEHGLAAKPNSIEIQEALAAVYVEEERWPEAVRVYQSLLALYPATASLFVSRIRLGAAALGLASLLALVSSALRPGIPPAAADPAGFARAVSSGAFFASWTLLLLAFPLFSTAAISIYKLLSYSEDHRPAFWAMVCSVLGAGFAMAAAGIHSIVHPLAGRLYLAGELDSLNLISALIAPPWSLALASGEVVMGLGILLFSLLLWRSPDFSRLSALAFAAGWLGVLFTGGGLFQQGLLVSGLLQFAGSAALVQQIWVRADLQFRPADFP